MTTEFTEKIKQLSDRLGCEIKFNEPLSKHTSFHVGGPCSAMVLVNTSETAAELLSFCYQNGIETLIIGNGSNLLCDDEGFDGVVLNVGKCYQNLRLINENEIEVEAGCTLTQLCNFALANDLTGLEFAYGIPGTVGGAVFMNAGAYDGEMRDVVVSAQAVCFDGRIITLSKDEMELSYRSSAFQKQDCIITKAVFGLKKGNRAKIKERMDELMQRRISRQPLDYPSAGSTFKRPPGQFAGKLVEDCGLKGYSIGDAQVSQKHCGFIINKGNATFEDLTALIKYVQDTVLEKTGFFLECEVKIISQKK